MLRMIPKRSQVSESITQHNNIFQLNCTLSSQLAAARMAQMYQYQLKNGLHS
jgi:hypothetical protein